MYVLDRSPPFITSGAQTHTLRRRVLHWSEPISLRLSRIMNVLRDFTTISWLGVHMIDMAQYTENHP